MAYSKQTQEDIVNLFFCSYQEDPSGKLCENLSQELLDQGESFEIVLESQKEACSLFAKNQF